TYAYTFSVPIEHIVIAIYALDGDDIGNGSGESYIFSTNGSGNTVLSTNSTLPYFIVINDTLTASHDVCGYVKISNSGGNFTQLTITSGNPGNGVVIGICSVSTFPATTSITTTPVLSTNYLRNDCPITTVDLNSVVTNTPPSGTTLVWFNNNIHDGSLYATPDSATTGTYYAFFYDSVENCYSPASTVLHAEALHCDSCTMNILAKNPNIVTGALGVIQNVTLTGLNYITSNLNLQNVTFENAEILVEPGVKIQVGSDAYLHIQGSHLYACPDKWQGIEFGGGSVVRIEEYIKGSERISSFIEDAHTAVFYDYGASGGDGNNLFIDNTIFNKNNVGVHINNYTTNTALSTLLPVSIKNSLFTCRKIPFVPGNKVWNNLSTILGTPVTYPKTPSGYGAPYISNTAYPDDAVEAYLKDIEDPTGYSTQKSQIGIEISTVHGTTVSNDPVSLLIGDGSNNNPYSTNALVFDNHNIGIQAVNANITVNNCTFQKPGGFNGYGILSMGECVPVSTDPFGNTQYDCTNNNIISINTPTGTPNNAFFDIKTAISIAGGKQVTIKDCDIRSTQSKADMDDYLYLSGSYGIRVGNHYFENINISNNKIHNIRNAIDVFCARGKTPNNVINPVDVGEIVVENNIIGRQFFDENTISTGDEYIENAIHIASLYLHHENNAEPVLCKNNTIHEVIN
ncbi:MAG: hypothetical protein LC096_09265, partial [Bacteroidia bacterium]|nr:hypothetical protein [Bacteroidia bacterium]